MPRQPRLALQAEGSRDSKIKGRAPGLGRNEDADHRLARAWELARTLVMPQAILEVGALRAVVLLTLGRLEEAEALAAELVALGRRLAEFRPARAFSVRR